MSGPVALAESRGMAAPEQPPLLEVDNLRIDFLLRRGRVHAVRDVSFVVRTGESVALVGESGSGKSVTALAMMGLVKLPGKITGGDIRWNGLSLLEDDGARMRTMRGKDIAIVFQDPMTSMNPVYTVGMQVIEVLRRHMHMSRAQARERAVELFDLVGISSPRQRLSQYPHEFSGGMRQRALIAIALACEPKLLIADEPTTALDVTIQAQILELLADIQARLGLAVLMITHNLGVVAGLCHRVAVMYAGKIVEEGPIDPIFAYPRHPYTRGLLASTPRLDAVEHRLVGIAGSPPAANAEIVGCAFAPRCERRIDRCTVDVPPLESDIQTQRRLACWHPY